MLKKITYLHPVILSITPVLFLYAHNIYQTPLKELGAPIFYCLLLAAAIFGLMLMLARNPIKAAIFTSMFLIILFGYGPLYEKLRTVQLDIIDLNRHRNFIGLLSVLIIPLAIFIFRSKSDFRNTRVFLFGFGVILIALSLVKIIAYNAFKAQPHPPIEKENPLVTQSQITVKPDIYYIVLDGYGRADVLNEIYNFDNSIFLSSLKNLGFHIADKSLSNYNQTSLSLTSSLNMEYVDEIVSQTPKNARNVLQLRNLIHHSKLREKLESHGYKTRAFASGWDITEIKDADYYLAPSVGLSEFQNILLNQTPIPALFDKLWSFGPQYEIHRHLLRFVFDNLVPKNGNLETPVFSFIHIIAPHPPFVFNADGTAKNSQKPFSFDDGNHFLKQGSIEEYIEGYKGQLEYINNQTLKVLEQLIKRSKRPRIIILQGDHGPGSSLVWDSMEETNLNERYSILNAFYFWDQNYTSLYPSISPINTFRLILDQYFEESHSFKKDRHFFSSDKTPFEQIEITDNF